MKASDLLQIRPELIQYLGLDVGLQFTIHKDGIALVCEKNEE